MMGTVLFRLTLATCCAVLLAPVAAHAAATVEYIPPGQFTGAKIQVTGDGADDVITIAETTSDLRFERSGGGLTVTGAADCLPNTPTPGVVSCPNAPSIQVDLASGDDRLSASGISTPILATGGLDNDKLTGGSGNDVLTGGDGVDELTGNAGIDEFFGEGGDDTISAFDGVAERISCGTGIDHARNDPVDVILECEAGVDGDGDGFASFVDCNDGNASISPGAVDILENGVDENCDGADARNLDRDADGFPVPVDCNDANAAVHPGALEIRGNNVDENCDSVAKGFAWLRSLVSTNWQFGSNFTRLRALVVRNAPAGARITVRCKGDGCPFKGTKRASVRRDLAPVSLRRFFGKAKLRRGARVIVNVTAREVVGRTYTYRTRIGELPVTSIVCTPPGQKKGRTCG
jgi:hypothetical protein